MVRTMSNMGQVRRLIKFTCPFQPAEGAGIALNNTDPNNYGVLIDGAADIAFVHFTIPAWVRGIENLYVHIANQSGVATDMNFDVAGWVYYAGGGYALGVNAFIANFSEVDNERISLNGLTNLDAIDRATIPCNICIGLRHVAAGGGRQASNYLALSAEFEFLALSAELEVR